MTSIKDIKTEKRSYKLEILVLTALLLFFFLPDLITWAASGFDFDAPAKDSCLDNGSAWDEKLGECIKLP
jgi:hypothetical protein